MNLLHVLFNLLPLISSFVYISYGFLLHYYICMTAEAQFMCACVQHIAKHTRTNSCFIRFYKDLTIAFATNKFFQKFKTTNVYIIWKHFKGHFILWQNNLHLSVHSFNITNFIKTTWNLKHFEPEKQTDKTDAKIFS